MKEVCYPFYVFAVGREKVVLTNARGGINRAGAGHP